MTKDAWKATLYAIREDVRKLSEVPDKLTDQEKERILWHIERNTFKLIRMRTFPDV